jgi:hypothetical protein
VDADPTLRYWEGRVNREATNKRTCSVRGGIEHDMPGKCMGLRPEKRLIHRSFSQTVWFDGLKYSSQKLPYDIILHKTRLGLHALLESPELV